MFKVKKRIEICAAHFLKLSYESMCSRLHGHNWIVDVYLQSNKLNANGMIVDFDHISKKLLEKFDHKVLNEVIDFNPTAENLAKYICEFFAPHCYRVDVTECEGNVASFFASEK